MSKSNELVINTKNPILEEESLKASLNQHLDINSIKKIKILKTKTKAFIKLKDKESCQKLLQSQSISILNETITFSPSEITTHVLYEAIKILQQQQHETMHVLQQLQAQLSQNEQPQLPQLTQNDQEQLTQFTVERPDCFDDPLIEHHLRTDLVHQHSCENIKKIEILDCKRKALVTFEDQSSFGKAMDNLVYFNENSSGARARITPTNLTIKHIFLQQRMIRDELSKSNLYIRRDIGERINVLRGRIDALYNILAEHERRNFNPHQYIGHGQYQRNRFNQTDKDHKESMSSMTSMINELKQQLNALSMRTSAFMFDGSESNPQPKSGLNKTASNTSFYTNDNHQTIDKNTVRSPSINQNVHTTYHEIETSSPSPPPTAHHRGIKLHEFRKWWKQNTLNESQEFQNYLAIITNAGFDTVELVCCVANDLCMTAQDLIELGITKPQHVKRIMQFVEQEKEERRKRGVDDHLVLSFESDQKDQRYRGYG
eukprot:193925_1